MRTLAAVLGVLTLASLGGFSGQATPASTRATNDVASSRVVPLRVQRVLKTHAPRVAYVPTRLPRGFRYDHYENLGRSGFDLYFNCCSSSSVIAVIGFDALVLRPGDPCNQGSPMKRLRIDGILVLWNSGHNDQMAWRCIRRGRTRLLLTGSTSSDWRTPRRLAQMVASARPIG